MILKLEADRDIPKMYPHTEDKVAILKHLKLGAYKLKKYKNIS